MYPTGACSITESCELIEAIFIESTIASQTAATALLISHALSEGVGEALQPQELVTAMLSVLTDLTQVRQLTNIFTFYCLYIADLMFFDPQVDRNVSH